MASSKLLVVLAALALLATATLAAVHVVGDEAGWKLSVNYTEWAAKNTFNVGDKLVFIYGNKTAHNVLRVDGASFKNCSTPPSGPRWNTGTDEVELTEQGRQWYICGIDDHCLKGMKFAITVQGGLGSPTTAVPAGGAATGSPVPAPALTSAATIVTAPMFLGSLVALLRVALF